MDNMDMWKSINLLKWIIKKEMNFKVSNCKMTSKVWKFCVCQQSVVIHVTLFFMVSYSLSPLSFCQIKVLICGNVELDKFYLNKLRFALWKQLVLSHSLSPPSFCGIDNHGNCGIMEKLAFLQNAYSSIGNYFSFDLWKRGIFQILSL